jgi:hypothetical protein
MIQIQALESSDFFRETLSSIPEHIDFHYFWIKQQSGTFQLDLKARHFHCVSPYIQVEGHESS